MPRRCEDWAYAHELILTIYTTRNLFSRLCERSLQGMAILTLHDDKQKELEEKANLIRQDLIKMLVEAGSGHSAGPLDMADIFTCMYFHVLNHDSKKPFWEDRDRLVLSNGHICPILYAALAHAGYFPISELTTLRKFGTRLQGHPHRPHLPGIETTSGPLGSGLAQAAGMAKVALMDGKKWRVYCMMSDGEHDAGNTWEGAMFAGKNKLHNLTAIMDRIYETTENFCFSSIFCFYYCLWLFCF